MPLVSLIYVSYASHHMSNEEIMDILKTSREKNEKKNITGMLLYRDRYFIQALEGEEEVIMPLYNKIKDDERHGNVVLVRKEYIDERAFDQWSMGFKNLDDMNDEELARLEGFTDFLTKPVPPSFFTDNPTYAKKLLTSFHDEIWW